MRDERQAVLKLTDPIPGVEVEFVKPKRGGHSRAVIKYGGKSRFVILSCSYSDRRAEKNTAGYVRKELRALGALQ
ncbi:hypothetical protein [Sphingomonas jaspsi]|uniref:hypothetical protein n=1 Tax=Sphingomonas jaspsi TaxID=392409 RepID=UPI0004B63E2C|nr:hypothetical protein [Sphingomonas jaspsi]